MSKKKRIALYRSVVLSGKAMEKKEDFREARDKPFLAPESYADHLVAEGFAYVPDKDKKQPTPPVTSGSEKVVKSQEPPVTAGSE